MAFLLAFVASLPILFAWNRSPALLEDSDTKGILTAIRAAHDPLKWFRGDWPIENHFYRPVVSLVFEADNALYHDNAAGYGLTNALLCFLCPLLLFWLLRELTDRPWPSALGASVFALWNVGLTGPLSDLAYWLAWITLLVGSLRHRRAWRSYLPATLVLFALSSELLPIRILQGRMIDWIPGRTASTMTVLALVAMAAYARYERLRRPEAPPEEPTPQTPPAPPNTEAAAKLGNPTPWAFVALAATAHALGTYEQAVMLPAALGVLAFAVRHSDPLSPRGERGSDLAPPRRLLGPSARLPRPAMADPPPRRLGLSEAAVQLHPHRLLGRHGVPLPAAGRNRRHPSDPGNRRPHAPPVHPVHPNPQRRDHRHRLLPSV